MKFRVKCNDYWKRNNLLNKFKQKSIIFVPSILHPYYITYGTPKQFYFLNLKINRENRCLSRPRQRLRRTWQLPKSILWPGTIIATIARCPRIIPAVKFSSDSSLFNCCAIYLIGNLRKSSEPRISFDPENYIVDEIFDYRSVFCAPLSKFNRSQISALDFPGHHP